MPCRHRCGASRGRRGQGTGRVIATGDSPLLPPSVVARTLPLPLDLTKTLEFSVPTLLRTRHHHLLVGPLNPSGACSPWIPRPAPLRLCPCPAPTDVALYDDLIFRYFLAPYTKDQSQIRGYPSPRQGFYPAGALQHRWDRWLRPPRAPVPKNRSQQRRVD